MTPEIENEKLRTRMGEMAAEIERLTTISENWLYYQELLKSNGFSGITDLLTKFRQQERENAHLQSVIDEANAQVVRAENAPRVATSDKVLFNGSHGHAGYVIEEQQSPAIEVTPEMLEAAQINTEIGRHVCGNWAGAYGCLEELFTVMYSAAPKQSPAVAVPDSVYCSNETTLKPEVKKHLESLIALRKEMQGEESRAQFHAWADEQGFFMDEVWSSVGEPFEDEDTQLAWLIWQASRAVLGAPSPRITEQDALQIIKSWSGCFDQETFEMWVIAKGSTLLDKLNGAKNAR